MRGEHDPACRNLLKITASIASDPPFKRTSFIGTVYDRLCRDLHFQRAEPIVLRIPSIFEKGGHDGQ